MNEFCVFFHDQKFHRYYIYYSSGKYEETDSKPSDIDNFEHSRLTKISINDKLQNGITLENILKDYCLKIQQWRNEILSSQKLIKKFDYFLTTEKRDGSRFSNTNETCIMRFFTNYSSKIYTNDKFQKITWTEYLKYEQCFNGALMRCFKTGEFETIGYDFKMFYPTILASKLIIEKRNKQFYFPIKEGRSIHLDKLNHNLVQYGLYDVKISATNPEFSKIFDFNYNNVYTHFDLQFAYLHREMFGVSFELIHNKDFNALVYDNNSIIDGHQVFSFWYDRINELKTEFPNNGLIKLLSSSMWGYLSKINRRYYNDKELDENPSIQFDYDDNENITHLCYNERDNKNGSMDYFLVDKKEPYVKNFRLKPFIQSFTRCIMGQICLDIGIEKVLRINTDNITFDRNILNENDLKNILKISPQFIEEQKTTGHFNIHHINKFIPV